MTTVLRAVTDDANEFTTNKMRTRRTVAADNSRLNSLSESLRYRQKFKGSPGRLGNRVPEG